MEKIRPIYEGLTEPNLLERCVGGFTQNSNESFNNSVRKLVPKTSFSGFLVLNIGVYTAVTCFNDGHAGFLMIIDKFEVKPGKAACEWVEGRNYDRLFHAERRRLASTKEARVTRRKAREDLQDDAYEAGAN